MKNAGTNGEITTKLYQEIKHFSCLKIFDFHCVKNAGTNGGTTINFFFFCFNYYLLIFDINHFKMNFNNELKDKDYIKIIVKPNSKENKIVKFDENKEAYVVNIKAKPEKNKANIEIIKFFSKLLKKKITIIKGLKSREKIIKVF